MKNRLVASVSLARFADVLMKIRYFIFILPLIFFIPVLQAKTVKSTPNVQLYTLNCGYIDIHDGSDFSDTEFYSHKPLYLANPCFLIKHPKKGWLLWDLGLGDQYVNKSYEDTRNSRTICIYPYKSSKRGCVAQIMGKTS